MARTLANLRQETLQWLDDPAGSFWAPAGSFSRIDMLINSAYEHMVGEVEEAGQPWNVAAAGPLTLNVTEDQREYPLTDAPAPGIRKIIDVVPLQGGNRGPSFREVPFSERNSSAGSRVYPRLGINEFAGNDAVYYFRRSSGVWVIGFSNEKPRETTAEVTYEENLTALTAQEDTPGNVPDLWHGLVALYAALLGKIQTRRDPAGLEAIYAREVMRLGSHAGTIRHASRSQRI